MDIAVDERKLLPSQTAHVMIGSTTGEPPVEVFSTDEMIIEAPNRTLDGRWLILNGDGKLWRLATDGSSGLEQIELSGIPPSMLRSYLRATTMAADSKRARAVQN